MKLKTIEISGKTYAEIAEGKPVYVHDDGKEIGFDAPASIAAISSRNAEAKANRERYEAAEGKLKAFDGISDAPAAIRALELAKNVKDGELISAGKVEEIKAAASRAAAEQVAATQKTLGEELKNRESAFAKLQGEYYSEKIGAAFSGSKFIADKVAIPADMLRAQFGDRFKIEEGKIVPYDASGNKIYSRAKPGEIADFNEGLEAMVDSYQYRDAILKGTGSSGSGARQTAGAAGGGSGRTVTKAQFDAMGPMDQARLMSGPAVPTLVD